MASHAERVLGAIVNKKGPRRDLLAIAIVRLMPEHFATDYHKNIFRLLVRYYDRTGDVMPLDTFAQTIQSGEIETTKAIAYVKAFELLTEAEFTESDFKWSVDELISERAKHLTGIAIAEGMEILERGYTDSAGQRYEGAEQARAYMLDKILDIDKLAAPDVAPEGDLFASADDIWKAYDERKTGVTGHGIMSGIPAIDLRTGGFQKGELCLICAYAGIGKSQIVTQTAWHCAVVEGKNVFFATTETLRDQVMRRMVARHSMLPIFDHAINSSDIKKGTLSASDEKVLQDVLEDFRYNTTYGKLNVVQMPAHTKLSYMENRLREYGREMEISLAIADYLALFEPEARRNSEREEFNKLLRGAKGIAQSAFDGKGVPFLSPWQISRDAYDYALRNGYYNPGSTLADTSEADKSADQIMAIIRQENQNREASLQYLKLRDEELPPIQQVAIDFRHTFIGNRSGSTSLSSAATSGDDLMQQVLNA